MLFDAREGIRASMSVGKVGDTYELRGAAPVRFDREDEPTSSEVQAHSTLRQRKNASAARRKSPAMTASGTREDTDPALVQPRNLYAPSDGIAPPSLHAMPSQTLRTATKAFQQATALAVSVLNARAVAENELERCHTELASLSGGKPDDPSS